MRFLAIPALSILATLYAAEVPGDKITEPAVGDPPRMVTIEMKDRRVLTGLYDPQSHVFSIRTDESTMSMTIDPQQVQTWKVAEAAPVGAGKGGEVAIIPANDPSWAAKKPPFRPSNISQKEAQAETEKMRLFMVKSEHIASIKERRERSKSGDLSHLFDGDAQTYWCFGNERNGVDIEFRDPIPVSVISISIYSFTPYTMKCKLQVNGSDEIEVFPNGKGYADDSSLFIKFPKPAYVEKLSVILVTGHVSGYSTDGIREITFWQDRKLQKILESQEKGSK